jgi:hypothetical protein
MRKTFIILLLAGLVLPAVPAMADLQNLTVGGEIRIRGNYYRNVAENPTGSAIRWPGFLLPKRAIGTSGSGISSIIRFDDQGHNLDFVEQRTRLNFTADFTNEVRAFIELDSWDNWGSDFTSNYITGVDGRRHADVNLYQAYIEANEMWGTPLRLRIGRQELSFGSEWLVGVNDASSYFFGLSFDGVRATYATDVFSVDAWWTLLAEDGFLEEDGEVDFYGIYGSYLGLDNITIDAYWMLVRDAREIHDTQFVAIIEWIEQLLNLDQYEPTYLHTIGLRGAGTIGAFDFEAEAAYQFGDSDAVGTLFAPLFYGDDDSDFGEMGANLEVGYTFDTNYQPRVYLGGAYFGGEDNRDLNLFQFLNPFYRPEASVSFNRLFSNWEYSEFITNTDLSNAWVIRGGVSAMPTESLELLLTVSYFVADEAFESPHYVNIGGFKVPVAPGNSWLSSENDDDLGWEVGLYATYHYTEDLTFELGWAHFFVGDGAEEGNFSANNGLGFIGGRGDDDADYLYLESRLAF